MPSLHATTLPPPALPGSPDAPIGHGSAFSLILIFLAVSAIGGVLLGNLLADRLLRNRPVPLTYGRQIIVSAFAIVACAVAIFAVLSFATMMVMKFML